MADVIPRLTTFMHDGAAVAPTLFLRPAESSDEALLLRVFTESHCAGFELLGLAPAALDGLVRMQFQARQSQYRMHPGAAEYLIYRDGIPVGTCWLSDGAEQLRVLDIAVLVEHRRRGVARAVLAGLCAQAAAEGKPVGLSVWHDNAPARELYRALGFVPGPVAGSEAGELGNGYLELRYFSDDARDAPAQQRAGAR